MVSCIIAAIGEKTPSDLSDTTEKPQPSDYKYKNNLKINAGLKTKQSGSAITVMWGRVPDAGLYEVYGAVCDRKLKLLKTVKGGNNTRTTIKKLNGKKLDLKKNYKFYIIAFREKDGKKVQIGNSLHIHIAGRKSCDTANIKGIRVKKKSYTLNLHAGCRRLHIGV